MVLPATSTSRISPSTTSPRRIAADSATCPSDQRTTALSCCLAAAEILTPAPHRNEAAVAEAAVLAVQRHRAAARVLQEDEADEAPALQAERLRKVLRRTE